MLKTSESLINSESDKRKKWLISSWLNVNHFG